MKFVVRFLMFWYDFLVGDCWQIAAGVVAALILGAALIALQPSLSEAFGPVLAVLVAAIVAATVWLGWRQKAA